MNKKVRSIVAASMISSMLLTANCYAEELGNVSMGAVNYPIAQGISRYEVATTSTDEDEFLQDLFGDVYKSDEKNYSTQRQTNNYPQATGEPESEEMVEDIEDIVDADGKDEYNNADRKISEHFSDAKEKLKKYAESEDYATLKREAKKMFVEGIDFLFFDGEIDGFTREQMTEQGKKDIMNTIEGTGLFLDEYFPGFSDSFGQKYSSAKEFLGEKYVNALDKIKGWIGEDTYEGVSNMGKDFIENVGDLLDILGESYQGWSLK